MGLPLPNGKLAMWLFLVTEIMFFTALIGMYIDPAPIGPDRNGDIALADAARRPPGRVDRRHQHVRADLLVADRRAGPLRAAARATSSRRRSTSRITLGPRARVPRHQGGTSTRPSSTTTSCPATSATCSTKRSELSRPTVPRRRHAVHRPRPQGRSCQAHRRAPRRRPTSRQDRLDKAKSLLETRRSRSAPKPVRARHRRRRGRRARRPPVVATPAGRHEVNEILHESHETRRDRRTCRRRSPTATCGRRATSP